jgi:hypothetical protein
MFLHFPTLCFFRKRRTSPPPIVAHLLIPRPSFGQHRQTWSIWLAQTFSPSSSQVNKGNQISSHTLDIASATVVFFITYPAPFRFLPIWGRPSRSCGGVARQYRLCRPSSTMSSFSARVPRQATDGVFHDQP